MTEQSDKRLSGKIAVVTGSAMGLGEAIARGFARQGAKVACIDLQPAPNEALVADIKSGGGDAISLIGDVARAADTRDGVAATSLIGDVARAADTERLAKAVTGHYGRIDILVNNAGVLPSRETVLHTSEADWDETMRVNVKGVFLMSKAVIPEMIKAGGGAIVNMSSITGLVGLPVRPAYSASKGAVAILTKQMAVDFGGDNIRVNALSPSFVITAINKPMFDKMKEEGEPWERLLDMHPLRHLGQPEDVAHAAIFLASDEASWITGVILPVDGGYTAC